MLRNPDGDDNIAPWLVWHRESPQTERNRRVEVVEIKLTPRYLRDPEQHFTLLGHETITAPL